MAEDIHTSHPIGWSAYDVAAQSSAIALRRKRDWTDVRKMDKEMASRTEDEIEVSTEFLWGSADTVGPT